MSHCHLHTAGIWIAVGFVLTNSSLAHTSDATEGRIIIDDVQVSLIHNTLVAAPIEGVIAKVHVAEGDQVQIGAPMVQLDTEQAETELVAAQAAYEAARLRSDNDVDARYARRTLDVRVRELEQNEEANRKFDGAVSQTEVGRLKLVVDQARLAIEQAEHELSVARAGASQTSAAVRIAEVKLRRHGITATVDGIVVEIAVAPGEWVDAGKPVVRLISLDPIRIECFVDGPRYGPELVGRTVEFYPRAKRPDDTDAQLRLSGRVTFVSPELHPITGQARVWATVDNPAQVARAGMRGRLVILPRTGKP